MDDEIGHGRGAWTTGGTARGKRGGNCTGMARWALAVPRGNGVRLQTR
ncbi:uncharacterized protein AruCF_2206 [Achromobacter ruhlandii]|nr:uncharacterized protein AruCF_2206 [Achromobacter ruhlandii]